MTDLYHLSSQVVDLLLHISFPARQRGYIARSIEVEIFMPWLWQIDSNRQSSASR
jgi:hypothetical protein